MPNGFFGKSSGIEVLKTCSAWYCVSFSGERFFEGTRENSCHNSGPKPFAAELMSHAMGPKVPHTRQLYLIMSQ